MVNLATSEAVEGDIKNRIADRAKGLGIEVSDMPPSVRFDDVRHLLEEIGTEFERGEGGVLFLPRGSEPAGSITEYNHLDMNISVFRSQEPGSDWVTYVKSLRHPSGFVKTHLVLGHDIEFGGGSRARYAVGTADMRSRIGENTSDFGFFCTVMANIGKGLRTDFTMDLRPSQKSVGSANSRIVMLGMECMHILDDAYGPTPERFFADDLAAFRKEQQAHGRLVEDSAIVHDYIVRHGGGFSRYIAERFCPDYKNCRRAHVCIPEDD